MFLTDDEYSLTSTTELDLLLMDLPLDLTKEQLRYQIQDPLSTTVNYVDTLLEKFKYLLDEYRDDEDHVKSINDLIIDVFGFLINEINDTYDLGVYTEFENVNEAMELGTVLYNFFILRYQKNITRFIYKYIIKNKKSLVEEFSHLQKKKDVTTISMKKKIKNKDDILILSNLPTIVNYIISLELDSDDFLLYVSDEEYYEGTYITTLINQGRMVGNFVHAYLNTVVDRHDIVLDQIQTDVKMKVLKKAK